MLVYWGWCWLCSLKAGALLTGEGGGWGVRAVTSFKWNHLQQSYTKRSWFLKCNLVQLVCDGLSKQIFNFMCHLKSDTEARMTTDIERISWKILMFRYHITVYCNVKLSARHWLKVSGGTFQNEPQLRLWTYSLLPHAHFITISLQTVNGDVKL